MLVAEDVYAEGVRVERWRGADEERKKTILGWHDHLAKWGKKKGRAARERQWKGARQLKKGERGEVGCCAF